MSRKKKDTAPPEQNAGAEFSLQPQDPPAPKQPKKKKAKRARLARGPNHSDTQILSYRHAEKRKNNPHVGLVTPETDAGVAETKWEYDPHIDPALQFDTGRAEVERLIDDALASGDEAVMRAALEELKRAGSPYLNWTGKAERTSFAIDTVSLHVHERIDPASILSAVRKRMKGERVSRPHPDLPPQAGEGTKSFTSGQTGEAQTGEGTKSSPPPRAGEGREGASGAPKHQSDLFAAAFENLPLRDAIDFYKHERGWANRLIAGDSLLVMNSLLQKESMAGQVQMIYIDPPYGIKYGSNFQPFTNKRDVKDRKDEDLTQEPEMIKAFRDTWELGIHSYLTYLRDRLLLAKELLHESGSVFVQISDDNVHHVREVMDEILLAENFIAEIAFRTTSSLGGGYIGKSFDYVVWYGKNKGRTRNRGLFKARGYEDDAGGRYSRVEGADKSRRVMTGVERKDISVLPSGSRIYRHDNLTSQSGTETSAFTVEHEGICFKPGKGFWKTNALGISRLRLARRIAAPTANSITYVRFLDDFPLSEYANIWTDTQTGAFTDEKVYVVQTNIKVIERCMLMTTDPGDLVFDPTCGSGTTAFVAEKWGRRWITCDTSRVAVTLAKQRLMTASYDYYELKYPHEGLKAGFIYKTVPHVTLKSIANNPEIDEIYERMHPVIESALVDLNGALAKEPPRSEFVITEGGRKGQKVRFARPLPNPPPQAGEGTAADLPPRVGQGKGTEGSVSGQSPAASAQPGLLEWEIPFDFPDGWPESARTAFDSFHSARQAMQKKMDASIAAHADQETLYDQPLPSRDKLRITGPFTVEAVPFPTVLALDEAEQPKEADVAIARSGESARQHSWRDELVKTGIRGKGGQFLKFADLEALPGTRYVHCSGTVADTGDRVVVSFGPEHAALEQRQVEMAMREAGELFPRPKMIVFCAFTFDPEAAKDIDQTKGITALKAQMNTDLLTEDLKKARASNQSFWLMGQPDVDVRKRKDGLYEVEVNGFDYFDTVKGDLVSGGKNKIAMWLLDTDYDERSLFPRQVFFPMAGKDNGWRKLKKNIRAELNEELLDQFHSTVSLPFASGDNRKVAVKIIDDRGIESLKVIALD